MKQTFTLTTLMLLIVTLSFGQTKSLKNLLKKDGKHSRGLHMIGLNSNSSTLKSTQDYKLQMDSVVEYSSYDEATDTYSSEYEDEKYVFISYNENGYVSKLIKYWLDEANGWSENVVGVFTYDDDNNLTLYCEYSYDEDAKDNIGTSSYKEEYTYDSNGYLATYIESNYSDGSWVPDTKVVYTNDDNGNCTQEIDYYYENGDYVYKSKLEISYDNDNQITSYIIYSYDEDWVIDAECTNAIEDGIVYNNNGYIEQVIMGNYEDENADGEDEWVNSFKVSFVYDSNNNRTDEIEYNYDNGAWVKSDDGAYSYDTDYTLSDIYSIPAVYSSDLYQYELLSEPINNIVTAQIDYTYDGENESFDNAKKFYYSEITTTSVDKTESDAISIYPNPVSSSFTVNFSNSANTAVIELYNATGNKLMSKEIGSGESVDIDNYTSGIYFYTLTVNGKTQNGKLLKK